LGYVVIARAAALDASVAVIAEFERDLIRERTGDGRKRAMANERQVRPQVEAVELPAR
jgi:hypothetical protein